MREGIKKDFLQSETDEIMKRRKWKNEREREIKEIEMN